MDYTQNVPAGQMPHKRKMTFDELQERLGQLGQHAQPTATAWKCYDCDGALVAKWLPRTRTLYYNGNDHSGGSQGSEQVDEGELDPGTMDADLKAEHFFNGRKRTSGRGSSGGEPNERQFRCEDRPDEYWTERGYVKVRTVGGFEWVRSTTAAVVDETA